MSPPLDLNLLRVLAAMLRTRNTTLAAEHLGMSQSAVSNSLKRMRHVLGDPLFVLSSDGMQPTALAERMTEPIQNALSLIEFAMEDRDRFDPKTSERKFSLYLSDVGQLLCLPPLLQLLRTEAPRLELQTVDTLPREAGRLMEQGEIDMAIGYLAPFGEGFHRQFLFHEHFVCLVRQGHPVITDTLSLEQYLKADHVIYAPRVRSGVAFDHEVEAMCRARGFHRRVALRLAYSLGVEEAVANSDFICTVSARFARLVASRCQLKLLPLPFDSPQLEVAHQWHGRVHKDPGHAWLRAKIATVLRDTFLHLPSLERTKADAARA